MNRLFISIKIYSQLKCLSFAIVFIIFGIYSSPSYAGVTYKYTGLNFDHQNPYNSALTHITIELTTPKPVSDNFNFPDVPQFQAQGYKLVITDGVNTISSSDTGFSFGTIAATNRIYSIDENGLPKTWSLSCELNNTGSKIKITMSSRYAPGIYANEGGDSTDKAFLVPYKTEYKAWTLGNSHVGIPLGSGSGKGTWTIKNSTLPLQRPQTKIPVRSPLDNIERQNKVIPR